MHTRREFLERVGLLAGAAGVLGTCSESIQRALAHHKGNISRAAASLGLTRPALYRRLARHGLANDEP